MDGCPETAGPSAHYLVTECARCALRSHAAWSTAGPSPASGPLSARMCNAERCTPHPHPRTGAWQDASERWLASPGGRSGLTVPSGGTWERASKSSYQGRPFSSPLPSEGWRLERFKQPEPTPCCHCSGDITISTKCWPSTHMAQNWALREGFQSLLKMQGRNGKEGKRKEEKKNLDPCWRVFNVRPKNKIQFSFFKLFLLY